MKLAMAALSELSVSDPDEFDKVMSRLEEDMAKQAEEQGIDLEEAYAKVDKQMAEDAAKGENAKGEKEGSINLPGGKTMPSIPKKANAPVTDPELGIEINPSPAFVLKTVLNTSDANNANNTNTNGSEKLFLNVCTHPDLPIPKTVRRLNDKNEEVEGLSIPVAVGPRRYGGKSGPNVITYDTVVNPAVLQEIKDDTSGGYRDFVCQLVMEYVEQKIRKPKDNGGEGTPDCQVDKRYKLPKMLYHAYVNKTSGEVIPEEILKDCLEKGIGVTAKQMIRKQTAGEKGIEEVDKGNTSKTAKSNSSNSKHPAKSNAAQNKTKSPVPAVLANQKLPITISILSEGEDTSTPLLDFLNELPSAYTEIAPDFADIPVPNPDNIHPSQLLLVPMLYNACDLEVTGLEIVMKIPRDSGPNTNIDVSASMFTVTAPGYLATSAILPFPCEASTVSATYDGAAEIMTVTLDVIQGDMEVTVDVGSRQWALATALGGDENDSRNKPKADDAAGDGAKKTTGIGEGGDSDALPEDKFHLNLPKNYNQHSGLYQDGDAEDDPNDTGEGPLPEDRFHAQDIISQHLISQRESDRQAKQDKADRERMERKKHKEENPDDDDGIEYLDTDDFKPGGRYHNAPIGKASDEPDNPDVIMYRDDTQKKAAKVMKEGVTVDGVEKVVNGRVKGMESSLWTELLD
jgi:hypothetical protein